MATKNKEFDELVRNLTKEQIEELVDLLKEKLKEEKIQIAENQCHCPKCGSLNFKKNGKPKDIQRYLCKDCKGSFSETTNNFFFHSRLPVDTWLKFIDCEITGMSLKEESYYTKVSVTTCFNMRHKLYRCLSILFENEKLAKEVELDASYFSINLKGTKPENMPRYSKHRGTKSSLSGLSHHKICVVSGVDSEDHMILKISGLGAESYEKYEAQKKYFSKVNVVVSDSKASIQQFSNAIGSRSEMIPVIANQKHFTTANGNSLGDVNELIGEFRTSNKYKHGFATRYLQDELNFYTIKRKLKYRIERDKLAQYILDLLVKAKFISVQEILCTDMPISLKEAYYEYHYGIFSDDVFSQPQQHLS